MIVMLYQEYCNHGFGSQEGDFSSKAGQLFQDSQAAGCKQQGSSTREGAEE